MKIRPLPITDLARIATLDQELQRYALQQVKDGGGSGSYRPTRQMLPDICNRHPGMFSAERAPWAEIEPRVKALSVSDKEEKMNLLTSKSIYSYCCAEQVEARELEGFPLSFPIGLKIICWAPALFLYPDRMAVPFFDMRRTYRLSRDAVTFMFSAMHLALRVNNPDYEQVHFEVLRLADSRLREVRVLPESGRRLFTYDQMQEMVAFTHQLWIEVLVGRRDDLRRKGPGGGGGDLFSR